MRVSAYQIETVMCLLLAAAGAPVLAQDTFKPQVQPGTQTVKPATADVVVTPNPIVTPAGANQQMQGQPIVYGNPQQQLMQQPQDQNDESQALMNAFGQLLSGGGLSNLLGGGRSEFANSGDNGSTDSGSSSLTPTSPGDLSAPYKIVPTFKKWFEKCTKGMGLGDCRFENMGIAGDKSHQARRSCHNSGQAIDVGTITCSGGQKITPKDSRFFDVAYCMANDSQNELQVIFHKASGPNMIQQSDHAGHMHVQLKGCAMVYGSGN